MNTPCIMTEDNKKKLISVVDHAILDAKSISVELEYDPIVIPKFKTKIVKIELGDYIYPLSNLLDPEKYNTMTQSNGSLQKHIIINLEFDNGDKVRLVGSINIYDNDFIIKYYNATLSSTSGVGSNSPRVKKEFNDPSSFLLWVYPLMKSSIIKKELMSKLKDSIK